MGDELMKITCVFQGKLNTKIAENVTTEAARQGLRDTIVAIHNDAVRNSPVSAMYPSIAGRAVSLLYSVRAIEATGKQRRPTGNNKRGITAEVSGMGMPPEARGEKHLHLVDNSKLEAVLYGTSEYGGYLEVGTYLMPARPYIRPAVDEHNPKIKDNIKRHMK